MEAGVLFPIEAFNGPAIALVTEGAATLSGTTASIDSVVGSVLVRRLLKHSLFQPGSECKCTACRMAASFSLQHTRES